MTVGQRQLHSASKHWRYDDKYYKSTRIVLERAAPKQSVVFAIGCVIA